MLDSWLTLFYTPYIGAKRFRQLIDHFGSAEAAVQADHLEWQAAGIPASVTQYRYKNYQDKVNQALQWQETKDHFIMTFHDPQYPPLLKEIHDPPMILFVKGEIEILSTPQIAIVGARKPTEEGLYNAHLFATELALAGLTVTSGLALGIDQAAHHATVKIEKPTIAVLGTGLNEIYPRAHAPLSEEILQKDGALVSEYPLHMPPKAQNFPRRNRIIAGLSLGTLVIEAAQKSGSLITARLSMEENREVFAIPGSIHQPQSRGCHQLIREGAALVESTIDIRTALSGWVETTDSERQADLFKNQDQANETCITKRPQKSPQKNSIRKDPIENINHNKTAEKSLPKEHPQHALYALLKSAKSINQLVALLNIDASQITADLMMLEIEDLIVSDQGFYQQK